jgi:quinol monooxygenase YgiN
MSIVIVATIVPIPEHRAEVIAAFESAIAEVHDEPGAELYALHEGADRLVMIEKYESDEAVAQHRKGAALAKLGTALDGKVIGKIDVQILTPHPAGTQEKGLLH